MRAVVVREYRTAPVVSEVADPAWPAGEVLAALLNPVDVAVAAGLNPFRRPELPLVVGRDGVARLADGALVHFIRPAVPYGAFAERVPLADAETVPLPDGLGASRAAALGICGVAAWTALAGTGALRPGAGTMLTSQGLPTLTERLLDPDQRGYDVILDTLWGPVIPAAVGAAARGVRVVHLGNSAGALATLAGPTIRNNGLSPEFPARGPSPEALPLTSGNHQNLSARTGEGPVLADAPQPLVPSTGRGRL